MNIINPALMGFMAYMQLKGTKNIAKGIKSRFEYEKETAKYQSKKREEEAEKLAEYWNMYNTGTAQQGSLGQLKSAAGISLKGAAEFQRSMANNYLLALAPQMAASTVSGGVNLLKSLGIQSKTLNTIGSGAANVASSIAPYTNILNTMQYINPLYAISSLATRQIGKTATALTGNAFLGNFLAGPAIGMLMPLLGKLTSTIANKITGSGLSRRTMNQIKPLAINATLHAASEFIDQQPINTANQIINQIRATDPTGQNVNAIELAQLSMLANIAANTSSIPILTSEFVNNIIRKNIASKLAYNSNLTGIEKYYRGKEYSDVIEKHAQRMEHGKFAHTFSENVGLAATEFSSFLQKMAIGTDLIKQLQIVLSGGNIKEEMKKFDKTFQTLEQRKAALFTKTMGFEGEESYINMYYNITQDSQSVLQRARSFEDAQVGLLSGIYEFTRLTAVETATLRTKAFGIKEPVKYNVIGKTDNEKGGILDWLSNKVPFFEVFRMMMEGVRNLTAIAATPLSQAQNKFLRGAGRGLLWLTGGPRSYAYHDERFNRLVEGFDVRREATLIEKIAEPFAAKFNDFLLKHRFLRIFGNENRLSLEKRKQLEFGEKIEQDVKAILKEVGIEKLSDQQAFYKYATTSMPDQFDLMVHHLANVALFTHAIMINTANLARMSTGSGVIEKPLSRQERFINRYTGQLVTNREYEQFMSGTLNAGLTKLFENAFESKRSWRRLLDVFKYEGSNEEAIKSEKEKLVKGYVEGLKHFFEKEKLTAESSWEYATKMLHKPLFTREFLNKVQSNKEFLHNIVENPVNAEQLLQLKSQFGNVQFTNPSELAENSVNMIKVDIAKISAEEFKKLLFCNCATAACQAHNGCKINRNEIERFIGLPTNIPVKQATVVASQPAVKMLPAPGKLSTQSAVEILENVDHHNMSMTEMQKAEHVMRAAKIGGEYTGMRKSTIMGKLSSDNTLEGVQTAKKTEEESLEIKQTGYLELIAKTLKKISKDFSLSGLLGAGFTKLKKGIGASGANDESLGSILGSLIGGVGLGTAGKFLLKTVKIGGPLAAVYAGVSGILDNNYGREKKLIEQLDKVGVIDYNWFGKSVIKRPDIISKLPLETLTQLLSFDDWNDKDKQFLQNLVTQKTKQRVTNDTQMKDIVKNEEAYNKLIKQRINENKEKQGALSYYTGLVASSAAHAVDEVLTLGGLFSSITSDDKKLYYQLERAAAIRFSTLPFIESEIRDWSLIEKLKPEQIKSLLKLNLSDEDRKRLQMILNTRAKQKNALYREQIKKYDRAHKVNKKILEKHAKMSAADVVEELEDKGIVDHNWLGNSEIKDWKKVERLDIEQIKKLIKFNDWDDETKKRLQNILQAKQEEQGKTQTNTQQPSNTVTRYAKSLQNKIKSGVKTVKNKIDVFYADKIFNSLLKAGVIEEDEELDYHVTDWNAIKALSPNELRALLNSELIVANSDGDKIKNKIEKILYSKTGKQIASERNAKNAPQVLKSKIDRQEIVSAPETNDESIIDILVDKLDQLIAVVGGGHAEQIKVLQQTSKVLASKKTDEIKHPIHEN